MYHKRKSFIKSGDSYPAASSAARPPQPKLHSVALRSWTYGKHILV